MPPTMNRPPLSTGWLWSAGACSAPDIRVASDSGRSPAWSTAACTSPWACKKIGCKSSPKWSPDVVPEVGGADEASPATISSAATRLMDLN